MMTGIPDVVAVGQVEQFLLVHAARGVEQDLVDGGLVAEAGLLQEPGVAAHRAAVKLGLYHQRQAVAQGELLAAARLLQGCPEVCHSGHFQTSEVVGYFFHFF